MGWRIWIPVLVGGALLVCGTHRTWVSTSADAFCARCHSMHPFFQAHRAGAHKEIACRRCHIGDHPVAAAKAKLAGARFLAHHHLAPATPAQGVVADRACRSADCHPRGGSDSIPWKGLLFHHSQHRLSGRSFLGENLRCTTCHGTARQPGHGIAVRREACRICHLAGPEGLPGGGRDRSCLVCHPMPATVDLGGGAALNHAHARAAGYGCAECHPVQATRPPKPDGARCRACHARQPERHLAATGIRARVHNNHVRKLSLACSRCHVEPPHQQSASWSAGFPAAGRRCGHVSGGGGRRSLLVMECGFCHVKREGGARRQERCDLCHPRPR